MLHVGIDVGSVTVKAVAVDAETDQILWQDYQRHEGRQAENVLQFLNTIETRFPHVPTEQIRLSVTGSGGRDLAHHLNAKFVQEVNAVCLAVEKLHPEANSVIDLGGQDAKIMIFKEDPQSATKKKILSMNDKCAGGTGAVLDKISGKLGIAPEGLSQMGYDEIRIHHVAGKCGVFAETDIISLQMQGIPPDQLLASLFDAIVGQNLAVLTRGHTLRPVVLLIGGPNTYIRGMQEAWRSNLPVTWYEREIPLPDESDLTKLIEVPHNSLYFAAIGAVEYGKQEGAAVYAGKEPLKYYITDGRKKTRKGYPTGLWKSKEELSQFKRKYRKKPFNTAKFKPGQVVKAFIGLDGGSTSTKAVLMSPEKKVLVKAYQLSKGNPIEDTKEIFAKLRDRVESQGATLEVLGVGTTGYAKDILRDVLQADTAIVETVAHTTAALHFYKNVDVICDVGGQDIKIMFLHDGTVTDFKLNTQCSAGNGYFLQSTATDFGIPVQQYADVAFEAEAMPTFRYGCAVFLQADIVNFQRQGWTPSEIMAGLAMVLPKNIWLYVSQIPNVSLLGTNFVLQGGTQHNLAAVKAQADFIESKFRGKEERPNIIVHEHCGESGSIGAALEVMRLWKKDRKSTFIGLDATSQIRYTATSNEDTRCYFCKNECMRTFIDVETEELGKTRRLIVGNSCEKGSVEALDDMKQIKKELQARLDATPNFADMSAKRLFKGFSPQNVSDPIPQSAPLIGTDRRKGLMIRRSKLRIGMPRVLNMYTTAPLFTAYFESLGVLRQNIVFSDYTSEKLYREGAKLGAIDPCYPSKVAIPHLHNLVLVKHRKKALDIIFFPMIDDLPSDMVNSRDCRACPTIAATPEAAKAAFMKEGNLFKKKGVRFLNTFVNVGQPLLFERQMYRQFNGILGLSKRENADAISEGFAALNRFNKERRNKAREVLGQLEKESRIGIVLLGRPYHSDPGINHDITVEFQKRGYPVFTPDTLPIDEDTLDRVFGEEVRAGVIDHPLDISDVWKHTLSEVTNRKVWAAKFAARHPNLVALEISNFNCGHDAPTYTMIEEIIESSGTPYFSFKDVDENKPTSSIKIRVETISYFLKRYREARIREIETKKRIDEQLTEYEWELRQKFMMGQIAVPDEVETYKKQPVL